jgi:hypothetical protein
MWMSAHNWSQVTQGKLLFRGAAWRSTAEVVTIASPADRTPVSMPLDAHKRIDDCFEKQFGLRFRSRSLFTTGNLTTAASYGEVRSVVAIGDFCFCWSPHVADLYAEVAINRGNNESIEDMVARLSYRCDDLASAIASGNEIMLVGSAFEARRWSADDSQRA